MEHVNLPEAAEAAAAAEQVCAVTERFRAGHYTIELSEPDPHECEQCGASDDELAADRYYADQEIPDAS